MRKLKMLHENNENFVSQISTLEKKQLVEIENLHKHAEQISRKEILEYETKLKSLNDKVSKITKELADNEKKYQLDIEKVTLEYDTKISNLQQRHLAQINTSSVSNHARNDIFRKKMEYLQTEMLKETEDLKKKNSEHQQRLVDAQHQLKVQSKQSQDQIKQCQDQVRQQDKLLRQYQTEIKRFQNQLKIEEEKNGVLQKTIEDQQSIIGECKENMPKRKKAMFNPKNNRLEEISE